MLATWWFSSSHDSGRLSAPPSTTTDCCFGQPHFAPGLPATGTAMVPAPTTRFLFHWPPPPPAPPPPFVESPPPPPFKLGNRTDAIIECEFFEGTDLTVSSASAGPSLDRVAATQRDCCHLCAKHLGCTNFVYMPDSGLCLVLPHVDSSELTMIPNPSTVGGAVHITTPEDHVEAVHFAGCKYEVGSAYTGGALTAAAAPVASAGGHTPTKQDCCDACAQVPACAKFVYEVYSGACQLFAPIAEQYYVHGLVSGTLGGRTAGSLGLSGLNVTFNDVEVPMVDPFMTPALATPPAPPALWIAKLPPPSPPPDDEQLAADVLADVSIGVGGVLVLFLMMCGYLVFSVQILAGLHRVSGGTLGRKPKILAKPGDVRIANGKPLLALGHNGSGSEKRLLGYNGRAAGVTKVTVQTRQLTQKKDVDVGGCVTIGKLRSRIWDEFSHLLGKLHKDEVALLCYFDADEASGLNPWHLVTEASSMPRVLACEALKLIEKVLIADEQLEVAFALALRGPKGDAVDEAGPGGGKGSRHGKKKQEKEKERKKERRRNKDKGGAKGRLDDDDEAEDEPLLEDDASALVPSQLLSTGPLAPLDGAPTGAPPPAAAADPPKRLAFKPAFEEAEAPRMEEQDVDPDPFFCPTRPMATSTKTRRAVRNPMMLLEPLEAAGPPAETDAARQPIRRAPVEGQPPADDEDGIDAPSLLGKLVEITGLVSQAHLNGRRGIVQKYDASKRRWVVRLDEMDGNGGVVAFRPANLTVLGGGDVLRPDVFDLVE